MKKKSWLVLVLALILSLTFTGSVAAAEIADAADVYRLAAGETIDDDLIVAASEVFIDGTVDGDLIVAAAYVEINGVVTGDVLGAAAGITINGEVGDDIRVGAAGIDINGSVGDDALIAGGGTQEFTTPIPAGARSIRQGIDISGSVGGDLIVAGGSAVIGGSVGGDLLGGLGAVTLTGTVDGDANLEVGSISVGDAARVGGTLSYRTSDEISVPAGVSDDVEYREAVSTDAGSGSARSGVWRVVSWFLRTGAILLGFALVGWLVMRFRPTLLTTPVAALEGDPGRSAGYGCLAMVGLMVIPLISALLVFVVALFWGFGPALLLFLFLFSTLALLWIFSPLITGLWLGRRFTENQLAALILGTLGLALIARIPILGWFIYLISFILALGAIIAARGQGGSAAGQSGDLPAQDPLEKKMAPA